MNSSAAFLQFLSSHGISLEEHGTSEKGLSGDQATEFVKLLQAHGAIPFGIEVWRKHGDRWRIDSAGGWIVDDLNRDDPVGDALLFLGRTDVAGFTVFTVQF